MILKEKRKKDYPGGISFETGNVAILAPPSTFEADRNHSVWI